MTNLDSILKAETLLWQKGLSIQSYGFSSSHVWMWELDYKESWVLKNWCFWTVVLEKTLASPLDCKEIQPVHPKGNQPWIFIGRTDAEAETPILRPTDVEDPTLWKRPWWSDRLKTQEESDRWDGWTDHRLNEHERGANSGRWWGTGKLGVLHSTGVAKRQTQLGNWTTYTEILTNYLSPLRY